MKLSRTTWLSLGIGIIVILGAFLFFSYSNLAREKELLILNIGNSDKALTQLVGQMQSLQAEKAQLEARLPVANSSLEAARAVQYLPVESIEYGEEFFKIAALHHAQILGISASAPTEEAKDGVTYQVMGVELNVSGNSDAIAGFLRDLATSHVLDGISVSSFSVNGIDTSRLQLVISLSGYKYQN